MSLTNNSAFSASHNSIVSIVRKHFTLSDVSDLHDEDYQQIETFLQRNVTTSCALIVHRNDYDLDRRVRFKVIENFDQHPEEHDQLAVDSRLVVFVRTKSDGGGKQSPPETIIQWITDKEAIQVLSKELQECKVSNKDILRVYRQLERFLDREQVIQALKEERSIFIERLNEWSETLLEVDDQGDADSDAEAPSSGKESDQNDFELSKLARRIVSLKKRENLLNEILGNYLSLFRDHAKLNIYRTSLKETATMLQDEGRELFTRLAAMAKDTLNYDLTKPCIIFDIDSQLPQITFERELEVFAADSARLQRYGFELPANVASIQRYVQEYAQFVVELRKIVQFYCTVAEQILLSQRPMLIEEAKRFTDLLESKGQSLTWYDGAEVISGWISELRQFMDTFQEENQRLRQHHKRVLDLIKALIDVPFGHWPRTISRVKTIMANVDEHYRNTGSWKKHWEYQLYKIMQYYFHYLVIGGQTKKKSVSSATSGVGGGGVGGKNTIQYLSNYNRTYELLINQRRLLFFDDAASSDLQQQQQQQHQQQPAAMTTLELQFNPAGFVVFEPSFEAIKQAIFDQLSKFVTFPATFRAFLDWRQAPEAKGRTLFYNIYYRNSQSFANVYRRGMNALHELADIREQFNEWCSLYDLVKQMKSASLYQTAPGEMISSTLDGGGGGEDSGYNSGTFFQCKTLEDYQQNLQQIKDLAERFKVAFPMNEIHCAHSPYVINLNPIKMFVEWLFVETEAVLVKMFQVQCDREIRSIETTCLDSIERSKRTPTTIDELVQLEAFFADGIKQTRSHLLVASVKLKEKIHFLKTWLAGSRRSMSSSTVALPNLSATSEKLKDFERIYEQTPTLMEDYRRTIFQRHREQLDTARLEVDNFVRRWATLDDTLRHSAEVITDFQVNFEQLQAKSSELNKFCAHFKTEKPAAFDRLASAGEEIAELYGKFHVLHEFDQGMARWLEMEWIVARNKLAKINQYLNEWHEERMPKMAAAEAQMLHAHLEEWRRLLALLELCRGDFYQQPHWRELATLLGVEKNAEDLQLADLHQRRAVLADRRTALLELNKRAFNDYSLRETLNELDQFAATGVFALYRYQTHEMKEIMLIKDWSQLFNQISDCFLLVQTIKNLDQQGASSFGGSAGDVAADDDDTSNQTISEQYRQAYKDWEEKLVRLEATLQLLNSVQRKWISLEPIYSASNTFFSEQTFIRFSNDFQSLMSKIVSAASHDQQPQPPIVRVLTVPNIESRLKAIDANFSATQKRLRAFIEESRQRFPRFYFLSDEDLLLILSGKVDLNQSALVKKLFVNTIGRLVYRPGNGKDDDASGKDSDPKLAGADVVIYAIESVQGEIVRLRKPVRTDTHNGPMAIEGWLRELDEEIRGTLKELFIESLPQVRSIVTNIELLAVLPSQLITLLNWIDYTEKTEEAIQKDSLGELKATYERNLGQLTRTQFYQSLLDSHRKRQQRYAKSTSSATSVSASARPIKTVRRQHSSAKPKVAVLENLCKMKIKQTVLDLIHFISVLEKLILNSVRDPNDWLWQSQLRFRLQNAPPAGGGSRMQALQASQQSKVTIAMGLATFEYTFEYLGCLGDSKLVHTELTNKCFLALTQAMQLSLGGNPYGPAGTGKTETVKALGHFFGRQVLVFNCDEAIDVKSMTRILVGLVKCGSWGCFDEFNRLQLDVLSILSSQIHEIQLAIKTKASAATLPEYGQVAINTNAAIFITLNPVGKDYGGRNRIPDNLKSLFLPVAMSIPDSRVIARYLLLAEGFSATSSKVLSDKLTLWFELAEGTMSEQRHYDYGLRAIKACLEAAGRRIQAEKEKKDGDNKAKDEQQHDAKWRQLEISLVIDTLREQIKSKLVDEDANKFDGLVEAIFGKQSLAVIDQTQQSEHEDAKDDDDVVGDVDHEVPGHTTTSSMWSNIVSKVYRDHNLIVNAYQTSKIAQLYEQLQTRIGIVLIGPSGSGKTVLWQVLRRVIELHQEETGGPIKQIVSVVINPKAFDRTKLFGYIDEDTREWVDGLVSVRSREIARDDAGEGVVHWLVFDGEIEPDWVEALNSVLDDNRVLTLPSGERIDFDMARVRFLFETSSLQFASPATISRLGVVCIDQLMAEPMIEASLRSHLHDHQQQHDTGLMSATTEYLDNQPANVRMSAARTLARHLQLSFKMKEPPTTAFDRLQRVDAIAKAANIVATTGSNSTNLIVTQPIASSVVLLSPALIDDHICVVGPVGCGKKALANEIIFTTNGHLFAIDCTPSSSATTLTEPLLASCSLITSGANKLLRSNQGAERLWIFVRHLELLSYDKWQSNSLMSMLLLLIKHNGFYHPQTFEWITLERFQIVVTATDLKWVDERLLTSMHIIELVEPSLNDIEAILTAKTVAMGLHSLQHQFPVIFIDLVRHILHRSESLFDNATINFLKLGIDILQGLRHFTTTNNNNSIDQADETIIRFEIYRTLRNYFDDESLFELIFNNADKAELEAKLPNVVHTSLNGSHRFAAIATKEIETLLTKWLQIYSSENEIAAARLELLPHLYWLAIDLCSFLADGLEGEEEGGGGRCQLDCQVKLILGSHGNNRKRFARAIAHIFGYGRVWSPNSITSVRHLRNELKTLLAVEEGTTAAAGGTTRPKVLLLIDSIHLEILPYLRDELYAHLNDLAAGTELTVRVIICLEHLTSLDRLLWLRQHSLHHIPVLNLDAYHRMTWTIINEHIEADTINLNQAVVHLFLKMFQHFTPNLVHQHDLLKYVSFVHAFVNLYRAQLGTIDQEAAHLQTGVAKLDEVSSEVTRLKNEAAEQKVLLDQKRAEADEAFGMIMSSMHQSEDKKVELEDVQKKIESETISLKERKAEIDKQLESIEPILQAAKAAVGGIQASALSEIRSLRAPPEVIRDILEGVLRLMGVNDTSWVSMKTFLSRRGVKDEIMNFDCHKISPEIRAKVEQLLATRADSFKPAIAKRASAAAAPMAEWVKANVEYSAVLHKIGPLEAELNKLESGLQKAQTRTKTLSLQLQGVDTEVETLRARMQTVTVEAAQIELSLNKSKQVLEQSEALVDNLSEEHQRWTRKLAQIEKERAQQVYRCLVSAAFVIGSGHEPSAAKREQLLADCFVKFKIEPFDMLRFLAVASGDEEEVLLFGGQKVSGKASQPNQSSWFPPICLICDPAHKALQYFDNFESTRLGAPDWLKVLELSIRFGRTLIIGDFNEMDIRLVPLAFRTYHGLPASQRHWTFVGDRKVDFNPKFQLYLLTDNLDQLERVYRSSLKLFRLVNLSPSFSSISTQLLRQIIAIKRPELEEQKEKVEANLRTMRTKLAELESQLLDKLSAAESGNILDNVALIEQLKYLKKSSTEVERSMAESSKLRLDLEKERSQYKDLAQFASNCFLAIQTLVHLSSMYYFGYQEFEFIFTDTLRSNTRHFNNELLCSAIYSHTARALFSEHRQALLSYFRLKFPSESSRLTLSSQPETETIGEQLRKQLATQNTRSRLMLVLTTPGSDPMNELSNAIDQLGHELISISMGHEVIGHATAHIHSVMTAKSKFTATAFGNEPRRTILCLSNLHLVTRWLPQLVQLLKQYSDIDTTAATTTTPSGVIVFITEMFADCPVALLEMCTKFAYESVPGLRAHISRLKQDSLLTMVNGTRGQKFSAEEQSMFNLLEYFHAICCERRFYIPFGWTKGYEFGFNEFRAAQNLLQTTLLMFQKSGGNVNSRKKVADLERIFAIIFGLYNDVIYGGKVDFAKDELILGNILRRCFNVRNVEGGGIVPSIWKSTKRLERSDALGGYDSDEPVAIRTPQTASTRNVNNFEILGLPLNADAFRARTIDEKLRASLQVLTAHDPTIAERAANQGGKSITSATIMSSYGDTPPPTASSAATGRPATTATQRKIDQPLFDLIYFQKLWNKILIKCKIDQQLLYERRERRGQGQAKGAADESQADCIDQGKYLRADSWNAFVYEFVLVELGFARRLMLHIDQDLNGVSYREVMPLDANETVANAAAAAASGTKNNIQWCLKQNQTPEGWLKLWPTGSEHAQDILIALTRVYIKLYNFERVQSKKQYNATEPDGDQVTFDLANCFHPKKFLNCLRQFAAHRLATSIDRLTIKHLWRNSAKSQAAAAAAEKQQQQQQPSEVTATIGGLTLEGALFPGAHLQACRGDSPLSSVAPSVSIVFAAAAANTSGTGSSGDGGSSAHPEKKTPPEGNVIIPLYLNNKRQTVLEHFVVPCAVGTEKVWPELGVALVLG